jgi:hypothetical protein
MAKHVLNYAGFKKISEDKDKVILRHPEGHEVHVAKRALSAKLRGELAEIPMAAPKQNAPNQKLAESKKTAPASPQAVSANRGKMAAAPAMMSDGGMTGMPSNPHHGWTQAEKAAFGQGAAGVAPAPVVVPGQSAPVLDNPYENKPTKLPADVYQSQPQAPAPDLMNEDTSQDIPVDFHGGAAMAKGGKVQHMDDGGQVQDTSVNLNPQAPPEVPAELAPPQQGAQQSLASEQAAYQNDPGQQPYGTQDAAIAQATAPTPGNIAASTPGAQAQQAAQVTAQTKSVNGVPPANSQGANPQQDPYGLRTTYDATIQGINEQKAGLAGEARATGAQGIRDTASLGHAQQNLQSLGDQYQTYTTELAKHDQDLLSKIEGGTIDPNHYMGSMSTGKHISTAIGLILGGMGAGLTGGPNLAATMLQSNIDRDIDAQKANIGKNVTLYSANLARMQNAREALSATRAQMMDMASLKLKQSAAQSQDPMAKARALQAAGQIDQQTAGIRGQQAMRMTMLGGVQQGTVPPDQAVQFLIPADQRPQATKELAEAQEAVKARSNAMGAFDQVAKLATVGGLLSSPFDNPRQIHALVGPITASLSKATAGRFTEQDAGMLQSLWPVRGEGLDVQQTKRAAMLRLINEKMNYPTLKAWNLDPGHWGQAQGGGTGQAPIREMPPQPMTRRQ